MGTSDNSGTFRETKQDFSQVAVDLDGMSAVLIGESSLCRYLADLLTKNAYVKFVSETRAATGSPEAVTPAPAPRTIIKIERSLDASLETPGPEAEVVLRLLVSNVVAGGENRAALLTGPAALISSDDDYKTVRQAVQAVARGVYFVSSRTGRS